MSAVHSDFLPESQYGRGKSNSFTMEKADKQYFSQVTKLMWTVANMDSGKRGQL